MGAGGSLALSTPAADPRSAVPVSPNAHVHPSARLAADVEVGHYSVVGAGVEIGPGTVVGHHVVVHDESRIGAGVRVDDHAVVGKRPMRAARSATTSGQDDPPAVVGDGCLVGTGAVVYRGAALGPRVLVADLATVRERVTVGAETIVGRGVAIENDTAVGARCKLETNAYLCAYTTLGDDVFVAPGVLTSNDAFLGRTDARRDAFEGPTVQDRARLGVGAVVLPGRSVETEAVVGAGAVLTRTAGSGRVWVGVPARDVRAVAPEQLRENGG